jgi:ubiquinone/menaquinone biosynthesis C-methylase UbiE
MPNPFTDQACIRHELYGEPDRLDQRSHALHAAKTAGESAATTIARLALAVMPRAKLVVDVGGGSGAIARGLADRLVLTRIVVLDQSLPLLRAACDRSAGGRSPTPGICGDFHELPLSSGTVDLAVAAFCLYHTTRPQEVLGEIARCVAPGGAAILATKSSDSYREIDEIVAASGLDCEATRRPSLYGAFDSDNAADVVGSALQVRRRSDQQHTFRFEDFDHLAAYVATSPKYRLPAELRREPDRLARSLRRRLAERPLTTQSTVTYIAGTRT